MNALQTAVKIYKLILRKELQNIYIMLQIIKFNKEKIAVSSVGVFLHMSPVVTFEIVWETFSGPDNNGPVLMLILRTLHGGSTYASHQ